MSESLAGDLDTCFSDPDARPTDWAAACAVPDDARIAWIAAASIGKYGEDWRFEVRDGRFHHGGGPATVFRIECRKALGFARGTAGQTRLRPGSV